MSSELKVDTISEKTSTNGVVIDGVTVKDGAIASSFISGLTTGKVLQVVGATSSTEQQTTSTSYVDITNLTVSITPSATTSKVLIFYTDTTKTLRSSDVSSGNVFIQLLRDSTSIAVKEAGFYDSAGGNGTKSLYNGEALIHLDSPSSTSDITYKIQIKASSSTTVESQYNDNTASIIAMEIGA